MPPALIRSRQRRALPPRDPEQVHVAGGLYHAPSPELLAVRTHIANNAKAIKKILTHPEFVRRFEKLGGDQLQRVPRGFPSDHPAADLLRHKDFTVGITRPPQVSETAEFFDLVLVHFRAMMPLIRFLNGGLKQMPRKLSFDDGSEFTTKSQGQKALNPKTETRNKFKTPRVQISKRTDHPAVLGLGFRYSDLFRISIFGFRIFGGERCRH